jgi:phage terminase large subunit-like protein
LAGTGRKIIPDDLPALIEVSRKNGKTALAAALCLYYLIADGEDGAEVDLAANSKE